MPSRSTWEPAPVVSREEVLRLHHGVAAMPAIPSNIREDIFRIHALEMAWDIGVVVYEPSDQSKFRRDPTAIVSASFSFTAAYRITNPSIALHVRLPKSSVSKSPV
jgi:hypothetical protein